MMPFLDFLTPGKIFQARLSPQHIILDDPCRTHILFCAVPRRARGANASIIAAVPATT